MPANIAHMLIAHKALQKLRSKGVKAYEDFANLLDIDEYQEEREGKKGEEVESAKGDKKNFRAYVNLGSLGPDLYYYTNLMRAAKDMLTDGYLKAIGVEPWSYHLHSCTPNRLPLVLIEILFRDAKRGEHGVTMENDDYRKLAYIAGHLTHVAADQIIHPVVNKVAGPYYRGGEFREKHRECEVFQDYFLYQDVYLNEEKLNDGKHDFFGQQFNLWADCIRGWTVTNTEDWFRYFLQRGFAETYRVFPKESEIEDAVDGILTTLRAGRIVGPYKKAAKEYESGTASTLYAEYVEKIKFVRHYRLAVELSVAYLIVLCEAYNILVQGGEFDDTQKRKYRDMVNGDDLSCPLRSVEKMHESARDAVRKHCNVELLSADYIFDESRPIKKIVQA